MALDRCQSARNGLFHQGTHPNFRTSLPNKDKSCLGNIGCVFFQSCCCVNLPSLSLIRLRVSSFIHGK
uniref:Uncharacterized protein n=1 Tax=Physcomitrium patens TaxID=3218 RepID=A0A2K1JG00_PHYPA|nr:hypothetical protein PHYPA_017831 [Physcomitrium patens]